MFTWLSTQNLATVAMAVLMAYVLVRSRTPGILRGELQIMREKTDRLEKENKAWEQKTHQKDLEIADLRARTDLSKLAEGQQALLEAFSRHNAAVLDNHITLLKKNRDTEQVLLQICSTLQAMEKRLERGLIMGGAN